jgi:hypothetical protein
VRKKRAVIGGGVRMNMRVVLIGVVVGMGAELGPRAVAQEITIAENGFSRAAIVVAADATEAEKHAAGELARFLKEVTGGDFAVGDKAKPGQRRLLVGPGAARLADPRFSAEGLGEEGLILRTVGDDLVLAGGWPRGTLYAVYTFLEDEVGCRWWSSKVSTIPRRP